MATLTTSLRLKNSIKEIAEMKAKKTHRSLCNYIEYLILLDNGKTSIKDSDIDLSIDEIETIKTSMQEAREGKVYEYTNVQDLKKHLAKIKV